VSVLSNPEALNRVPGRRRERTFNCAHPAQAAESRVSGLPTGHRLTLGQVLDSVWEGLCAGGTAECPLCRGRIVQLSADSPARCGRCGTTVS
jgi:hypothetical protein